MTTSWVVKLGLADSASSILINVSAKDSNKDLDLDLLATDGDAAFRGKVRTRSLDKLRAKHYDGSPQEWSSILKYGLVSKQSSELDEAVKKSLEIQCSISGKDPKSVLSVSFRTLVQDITQQLGTIELPQTEDTDDVDLFGWASQLADRRDVLEEQAAEQQRRASTEARNVDAIGQQLEELILAKAEHEQELISKFAMLLNEKKFELRRLLRVLENAQVDPRQLRALEDSRQASGKRGQKRAARQNDDADEDDESDAFEGMDVDDEGGNKPNDSGNQTTDDETTESDDDDDLDQPIKPQKEDVPNTRSKSQPKSKPSEEMPVPRDLPFTRRRQEDKKSTSQKNETSVEATAAGNDEDTASEEDEL